MTRRRARRRRLPLRPAHLAIAVAAMGGWALAIGLFVMWADYRPSGNVALLEAALSPPQPAIQAVLLPPGAALPAATREATFPEADYASLRLAVQEVPPAPARLIVDAIGVDARVLPLGLDSETGQMEVPQDVGDVGWYRHGAGPGEPGSAVLAAHVDGYGQGPGVFFALHELEPGYEVRMVDETGAEQSFVVAARTTYHKDDLPRDVIFSRRGEPVLTLVTCGGGFNETARSYDSNVVVYAVPIDRAPDYVSDW